MRFLADESCDFAVAEITQQSIDSELMAMAAADDRILLTEDKDFGWLAFVGQSAIPGVILIRYPAQARSKLGRAILDLVEMHGPQLGESFTVLQPGAARITRSVRG